MSKTGTPIRLIEIMDAAADVLPANEFRMLWVIARRQDRNRDKTRPVDFHAVDLARRCGFSVNNLARLYAVRKSLVDTKWLVCDDIGNNSRKPVKYAVVIPSSLQMPNNEHITKTVMCDDEIEPEHTTISVRCDTSPKPKEHLTETARCESKLLNEHTTETVRCSNIETESVGTPHQNRSNTSPKPKQHLTKTEGTPHQNGDASIPSIPKKPITPIGAQYVEAVPEKPMTPFQRALANMKDPEKALDVPPGCKVIEIEKEHRAMMLEQVGAR